ncbi:MBL fold metallo-hydrolase [Alkalilimnicola ehrlichii]|uniref:MBL fold metallo-hydrolase n=2 Tax=Alkalilimnicola ehrlichii TaxID=351052 RepID=A0A3E0WM18_9GAMM|nr:MBL fold metallo-hydrolase [Alkalilimnicola ehrlichii]RFA33127.1 MBL fold metallo-hydrolase [Alkalilimnicola ehrlichii]
MPRLNALLGFYALLYGSFAAALDYQLQPREIAAGVYIFEGRQEHFTRHNGGNIVNTGFVITDAGVVVIDTGPSRLYGEQMRKAIATVTDQPPVQVFITHHHPDHFLGNQAFADVPICALPLTQKIIARDADALLDNMYRAAGAWMEGTEAVAPNCRAEAGKLTVGERRLSVLAVAGHSGDEASDLMVYDHRSGTLFAGDIVFHGRAATTPHANIQVWLQVLRDLERQQPQILVPGHGPTATDSRAIRETAAYLEWLDTTLREAAAAGLDMAEALELEIPERFKSLAVIDEEFERSVFHLFPAIDQEVLHGGAGNGTR